MSVVVRLLNVVVVVRDSFCAFYHILRIFENLVANSFEHAISIIIKSVCIEAAK